VNHGDIVDTRKKIIKSSGGAAVVPKLLAEQPELKLVRGTFDPLLASHVARLKEIAGPRGRLVIILGSPEKPLLSAAARAELVAALAFVELVVLPPRDYNPGWIKGITVIELDDAYETAKLMTLVRDRHKD
jgi:bifunctional ADP-heptose synthase (sugar kinase/adenylyltransferase)